MSMYLYDQKPGTHFSDASTATLQAIRESEYSVLVGRNNCGKSFLLKPNRSRRNEKWNQFMQQWQQQQQNIDNSPVNLQQAIAELSDEQRATLAEIIRTLLGVELKWRQTVEGNSMSQKYISCGGHNISYERCECPLS